MNLIKFEERRWIYQRCSNYNPVHFKGFNSGIIDLFEGNYCQGSKLHIIYFSLTNQNIKAVIVSFPVFLPCIDTPKSSSDERLWYL